MKSLLIIALLGILYTGCTTQKTLLKGDKVYQFDAGPAAAAVPVRSFVPYEVIKPVKVSITDNGNYLLIKINPKADPTHFAPLPNQLFTKSFPSWKPDNSSICYFGESEDATGKNVLWYRDSKFVLQSATIPLKFRPAIHNPAFLDSFPKQTETGFNVGFLVGWKFNWNKFRMSPNILGQNTDRFSITPGLILSAGGVDLSTAVTRPKIQIPRKATMLTVGGAIVFGFNTVNIGYAFGFDNAKGPNSDLWVYRGRMWNGIILSLDLIK